MKISFDLSAIPDGFYDDPYPIYRSLREHSPLHQMNDGSLFLTRYSDVVQVYRLATASSDKQVEFGPKYGDSPLFEHHTTSLVFNDPPLHTRVRQLIMGAVNQQAMLRMEPAVVALVDRLLDQMADQRQCDLIADFAAVIPVEVIGNLLAIDPSDRGPLRGWSLAILGALEPVLTEQMKNDGNKAVEEFAAFLRELIADRRNNPLDPQQDGTWLLMNNPVQMQRLRDDPALINTAVDEMLRCEGPIQLNNRRLTKSATIGGEHFESGTRITLCIGAAGRDPEEFVAPDDFDVGRKPNRHVAFGHSAHACVGMNIARMEGRVAVGALVKRFGRINANGAPERDRRVRFRGFTRLPIVVEPV